MILPEFQNILLFLTAASILIIIPGPAVLYIVARSMEQGYRAGMVSVLGIGAGGLVHVFAAGIGISSLFVASAAAFSVLKYLGGLYLIYLGIRKLLDKATFTHDVQIDKKKKLRKIFYEGVVVNVFNPKAAIFFFAFLPQFISIEKGGVTSQIIFPGMLFILIAIVSDTLYVLVSGKFASWIKTHPMYLRLHKYVIGSIYIFLGALTLAANPPSTQNASAKSSL